MVTDSQPGLAPGCPLCLTFPQRRTGPEAPFRLEIHKDLGAVVCWTFHKDRGQPTYTLVCWTHHKDPGIADLHTHVPGPSQESPENALH